MKLRKTSKFMSLILRHNPQKVGLELDPNGWVTTCDLITAMKKHGHNIDDDILREVVETNDKKRFTFSECGLKNRANQGHSLEVDLNLEPQQPPEILYHGTCIKNWPLIQGSSGLEKRNRQHVHLSLDKETASKVGTRHGKLMILLVQARRMTEEGYAFYLSKNGVWLTEQVPLRFIDKL